MICVSFTKIRKSFGGYDILKGLSGQIKANEIVGLVGSNGSGKTTLFRIIAGKLKQDSGEVSYRRDLRLAYLDQIPDFPVGTYVNQILKASFPELIKLREEMNRIENKMTGSSGNELKKLTYQYGDLQSRFEQFGGYDMDVEIDKVAAGLKIQQLRNQEFSRLSGGEKTRVLLAQILLKKPDLLLLDEPTNHLDLSSIEWLEDYLMNISGSVFIISHDRFFLNKTVDRIFELENGVIEIFSGNYDFYVHAKKQKYESLMAQYKNAHKKIKQLKETAERYRIWGRINPDNSAHFAKAKRCEAEIEELKKIKKPGKEKSLKGSFRMKDRSGKQVVQLRNISKKFSKKEILKKVSLDLRFGEKTALLGKNGTGKTTIFRIISKELDHDNGEFYLGPSVRCGYLKQEVSFEDPSINLVELIIKETGLTQAETRNLLARYLFTTDDVFKRIDQISGGEKVRLKLCLMMQRNLNFLLLDEPTNHLDIISREVLENALEEFNGTILFISHDRYLINRVASTVLELEDGKITTYLGNYDYFREKKQNYQTVIPKSVKESYKPIPESSSLQEHRKIIKKLREIENNISWLEKDINEIEAKLLIKSSDIKFLNDLYEQKCALKKKLNESFLEWEYLAGEEEKMKRQDQ